MKKGDHYFLTFILRNLRFTYLMIGRSYEGLQNRGVKVFGFGTFARGALSNIRKSITKELLVRGL